MATYDLEEQEQISSLKHWWETYGNLVTGVLVAVAIAVVSYVGWQRYQAKQSSEASAVYAALQKAATSRDAKAVREAAGQLLEKYAGTAYAGLGAVLSAKVQLEAGDTKNARAQLAWAAGNAKDQELRDLARLRLAALLLDEKAHEDALKELAQEPLPPFAARYAELRGDALAAQGKPAEARAAYQAALAKLDAQPKSPAGQTAAALREIVQLKLDTLGEAK
jgi:predicted negative regulator of RcsB-dependent stress response